MAGLKQIYKFEFITSPVFGMSIAKISLISTDKEGIIIIIIAKCAPPPSFPKIKVKDIKNRIIVVISTELCLMFY